MSKLANVGEKGLGELNLSLKILLSLHTRRRMATKLFKAMIK
jgi:hypothetical protein